MHAEAELPVVLVVDRPGCSVGTGGNSIGVEEPGWRAVTADPGVSNIETHVEVLGDVPLGARANPPPVPVVVATGCRPRSSALASKTTCPKALQSADYGIGLIVIFHFRIAAVDRRPPPRAPEVLIRRVDVPGRGQVQVGCRPSGQCAAIDRIRYDAQGNAVLVVLDVRIAARILEDVPQRTLRVVDLGLEVVALADHRRVQLEAAADRPAPLVIRVTAAFWGGKWQPRWCVDVIEWNDLVRSRRDLGRTPGLVDAQIGDDVRSIEAAVTHIHKGAAAYDGARTQSGDEIDVSGTPNDLRPPRQFGRDRCREAVAELRRIREDVLAAVAGVGLRIEGEVAHRRAGVEVKIRLRTAEGEAG